MQNYGEVHRPQWRDRHTGQWA